MKLSFLRFIIKKRFFLVAIIIAIAFIDGFILQSPNLGPQFRGNMRGIILFSGIAIASILLQLVSLLNTRSTVLFMPSKRDPLSHKMWLLMKIVFCSITLLFIILLAQIGATSSYSLSIVLMLIGVSNLSSIFILSSLSLKMIRWSRFSRDLTVWSFSTAIMLLCVNLISMTLLLIDNANGTESIVKPSRCGLMCYSVGSPYVPFYQITYLISFFAITASSVILLKGFQTGLQKVKFWTVLGIALILILIRLDSNLIRDFVDSFNLQFAEQHYLNSIIVGLIGPLAGIMAGLAFYFMARSVTQKKAVNHLMFISYGVMLFLSLNQAIGISHFQYPPFGIVSISLIPLASYFLLRGVYYSALYVAQDQKLRTIISSHENPAFKELKFLSNVGKSENYRRLVTGISGIMKNMAEKMENESGVPSNWQETLENYVQSAIEIKLAMKDIDKGIHYYDIADRPLGRTWIEWVEQWWNCFQDLPAEGSFQNKNNNVICPNKGGNTCFLTSQFGFQIRHKCVIPKEHGIFFPISKNLISFYHYPFLQKESDLHKFASKEMDKPRKLSVVVDGTKILDVKRFRVHTRLFDIKVLSEPAGIKYVQTKAVSDGYWIFLMPLIEGSHLIHIVVEEIDNEKDTPKNHLELIYELEVI